MKTRSLSRLSLGRQAFPFFRHPSPATRNPQHTSERGIALVMVLCALFLLSLVVFGLAQRVQDETFVTGQDSRALDARALAFTGSQIGLHPLTTVKTGALSHTLDAHHRYEAHIAGEGGKINLNWLLAGEDPRKLELLKDYLENKGLSYQEREQFTDCLLDWVKPGDVHHPNGSTVAVDGQPVPGRPFQDLSEIMRVVGSRPLTRFSDWQKDFTLFSQGPIDLQWAGEEVVGALPGVGLSRAKNFVKQRRGPDGKDGTPDDVEFAAGNSPLVIPQLLGLSPDVYQNMISNLVILNDPTTRIVSVGQAYDVTRTIEVVARKQGTQPQILSWKEF